MKMKKKFMIEKPAVSKATKEVISIYSKGYSM
jgi:hypothetical protein